MIRENKPPELTTEDRAYYRLFRYLWEHGEEKHPTVRFADAIAESAKSRIVDREALDEWISLKAKGEKEKSKP
uniref:Uncharacterized protein n=1 Tax=viral metagenome TaxID=1070528 RepID=A0A6M3LKS2_9ZZZZ